jgi:nucleoside-diphosphate-sugar epimerase
MNEQTISILGCGWLGKPLAEHFIKNRRKINGTTTNPTKIDSLNDLKINSFVIDINKRNNDFKSFLKANLLVISIPSKNIEDFKYLISEIEKSTIKKIIFISSTSVYPLNNSITTEDSPIHKTALSKIEQLFRVNTNFKTTIIRFGGLIGYDRKPGRFFKKEIIIDRPKGYINLIHRDDCIQIINRIITNNIWEETLNACADSHPTRRDFYTREFLKEGRKIPVFNESSTNSYKIINSDRLKLLLNYSFKYANLMKYKQLN